MEKCCQENEKSTFIHNVGTLPCTHLCTGTIKYVRTFTMVKRSTCAPGTRYPCTLFSIAFVFVPHGTIRAHATALLNAQRDFLPFPHLSLRPRLSFQCVGLSPCTSGGPSLCSHIKIQHYIVRGTEICILRRSERHEKRRGRKHKRHNTKSSDGAQTIPTSMTTTIAATYMVGVVVGVPITEIIVAKGVSSGGFRSTRVCSFVLPTHVQCFQI